MKFVKTLTILSTTVLSILCANVYSAVVDVPNGSGDIEVEKPETNAGTITEGEDLVITVNMSGPAKRDEGGAFMVIAVIESGQSAYNDEDGGYRQVDLIADGHYGLYIPVGSSGGSLTIPTRANDSPNSHSTVEIRLRVDGWGIKRVDDTPTTITIEDNTDMQPEGRLQINFCPGLASQVREGESLQISLCLDRASGTAIPLEVEILNASPGDSVEPYSDGDLGGALLQIGGPHTIPAGVTRHDLPPIEALRDSAFENDEGFTVFIGYSGSLAVEVGGANTRDVVIKDTTRVHLNLGYEVNLDEEVEEIDDGNSIYTTIREFKLSLNASYPDSTNNTCTNDGDPNVFNYKVRFSTDTGEDFLESVGSISQQETSIEYGKCGMFRTEVLGRIPDNLYGTHRVTMEIRDDFPPTPFGAQMSFPHGRTKTFSIDLGTAPTPPPPPPPPNPGPSIVTVSADKTEVEEGGSVTLTFTRNHTVGTHTRPIRVGADSNIDVIERYGGCNSGRGVICVLLGANMPVPTSLRFDEGVDTLQFIMYITDDEFIYSAGTISATVAQSTGDRGNVDKRVEIVLVETDEEQATEYVAKFSDVVTCRQRLDDNGKGEFDNLGRPLTTCSSQSAPEVHRGKWERWVEVPLKFTAEPNAMSYRDMIDRGTDNRRICGIVSAENGTLIGVRRADPPSNKKWVLRVRADTGARDIILTVHKDGNPDSACRSRKIAQFSDQNMRLEADAIHRIRRPPQVTIADVTVSEDPRTLECTRTHNDPVLDAEGVQVIDAEGNRVTTPRIENFQRAVQSRFLLTAVLDRPAVNRFRLSFDEPAGWRDDVHYGYVPLPDDLLEMSDEDAAAAIHEAECRDNRYSGSRDIVVNQYAESAFTMINVFNDEIDEGNETYDLKFYIATDAAPGGRDDHEGYGAYLTDNVVRITIENSDPIPSEWVANFSHSVGKTVVRNVANRMRVLRETSDGEVGTWITFDRDSFSHGPLSGSTEGFMIGTDRSWETFDAGLAISSSQGTGTFNDIELGGDLLGVYPYVQAQPEPHYSLWGTAGMAYGHITVQEGEKEGYETNMSMSMGAAGLHWDLLELMGADLAFESDLMFVSAQSDAVRDMQAAETSSRRLHMALSGTREWEFEHFRVSTTADLGMVHETGDVQEGFGTEGNLRVDLHHEHVSAGLRVGTSRTNGASDSNNTHIGGSIEYDWSDDGEGIVASYQPDVSLFGDKQSYGSTSKVGYGVRRSGILWTTYLLHSTQQARVGLNAKYTEGSQLQVEGSQDTIQASLRLSW